jgi:hypothetical protein
MDPTDLSIHIEKNPEDIFDLNNYKPDWIEEAPNKFKL